MRLVVKWDSADEERLRRALAQLSERDARRAMARALNREGASARVQVKSVLKIETGIKPSAINSTQREIKANANRLQYSLVQSGRETNLNAFQAKQRKSGVSAAPWALRRIFPHSFVVKRYGGKVFVRAGAASAPSRVKLGEHGIKGTGRFPIRQLFGPNLAREVVKGSSAQAFADLSPTVKKRIEHEIVQILAGR